MIKIDKSVLFIDSAFKTILMQILTRSVKYITRYYVIFVIKLIYIFEDYILVLFLV